MAVSAIPCDKKVITSGSYFNQMAVIFLYGWNGTRMRGRIPLFGLAKGTYNVNITVPKIYNLNDNTFIESIPYISTAKIDAYENSSMLTVEFSQAPWGTSYKTLVGTVDVTFS